jgi:hypothetical protein
MGQQKTAFKLNRIARAVLAAVDAGVEKCVTGHPLTDEEMAHTAIDLNHGRGERVMMCPECYEVEVRQVAEARRSLENPLDKALADAEKFWVKNFESRRR